MATLWISPNGRRYGCGRCNIHNSRHILKWYEWDLLVFCIQISLQLAALWTLTRSQTALVFMCLQYKSFENTVGKGKLLVTSNFSFSHSVFYPLGELSAIFNKFEIVICKLFSVLKGLNFLVWERVNVSAVQVF